MKQHTYIAIDLKSFYASVECRERGLDPLNTNLVVADESRTDKTICLAVTPSLKSYGISGRGRLFEVKQRVKEANAGRQHDAPGRRLEGSSHFFSELQADPSLAIDFIIAPPRMAYYMEYSTRIYQVYLKYIAPEDIVVYSILSEKNLPYKILMQQPGSSQDKVLNEFKEDTNSVLLGTGAYWEGISIEGKSLSNVIIFRLPFPVPDPIIEYKCSVAKDALMDVRVPEMIIKLKQGIGRLIRNFTDTGIVCIIDRRLRDEPPERYHDITWDSLPIKNRTSSLDELRKFYEGLPSAKE